MIPNIHDIMQMLAQYRRIFHSEADFQHAFAWLLHKLLPEANVRLELPVTTDNEKMYVDIWISYPGHTLAVELKYKTRGLATLIDDETFQLSNHGAQDLGRYDFIKDIVRLERITHSKPNVTGYAVLLTNDNTYWNGQADTIDGAFRLFDTRQLNGVLQWHEKAGIGTIRGREKPLSLIGQYPLTWHDYSHFPSLRYGRFCYLAVPVS